MNIQSGKLSAIVIAAFLMTSVHALAVACPEAHFDPLSHQRMHQMHHAQLNPEMMSENIKFKLNKLSERLEIKASQQAAWDGFAKSFEKLAERKAKKTDDAADAATIARQGADNAADFAKKLAEIAKATATLQSALSEDQRKIFNQAAHRLHDRQHEPMDNGMMEQGKHCDMEMGHEPPGSEHQGHGEN